MCVILVRMTSCVKSPSDSLSPSCCHSQVMVFAKVQCLSHDRSWKKFQVKKKCHWKAGNQYVI